MAENNVKTNEKPQHWKKIKAEFKKIIWPTKARALKQTGAVIAVSVVLGGLIAIIDYVFKALLGLIL